MMVPMLPVVDDLLAAPVGVALLDRLEAAQRKLSRPFDALGDSDPVALEHAIAGIRAMSLGGLLRVALKAADSLAGPWTGGAPDSLALAYRFAGARRALAEAVWQRFAGQLGGPPARDVQEHWLSQPEPEMTVEPAFGDLSRVYGNGEFTWAGLWTVSTPPNEIHDELVLAWDFSGGPITRWRLPIRPGARVWNIDHPADWVALVETFPKTATSMHHGWELPGPNQHRRDVRLLASFQGQHGVRTAVDRQVLPDWTAVAGEYDGVHLSWSGFLTSEGFVSDLPDGGETMLRYWGSERTLWLADLFGDPEPLGAPLLSGSVAGMRGSDATSGSPRASGDLHALERRLNRSFVPRRTT